MMKELPRMYQSKVGKEIPSIQKVYSSINDKNTSRDYSFYKEKRYDNISIDKKIDNIFKSNDYVYKAKVIIVTDNDNLEKVIVARNNNNLITLEQEYIPISIIRDIYKV